MTGGLALARAQQTNTCIDMREFVTAFGRNRQYSVAPQHTRTLVAYWRYIKYSEHATAALGLPVDVCSIGLDGFNGFPLWAVIAVNKNADC